MLQASAPRPVDIRTRPFVVRARPQPSNDITADTSEPGKHGRRGRVQDDRFRAGLAVREQQQPAFKIYMLPFKAQNVAQPCTS
jgi:hypothetical protein